MTDTPGYAINTPATNWYHKTFGITDFSANDGRFIVRSYSKAIISSQDTSKSTCEDNTVTFSVTATGSDIQYQWSQNCGSGWDTLVNNATYSGVQTSVLTINNPSLSMNGCEYECVMENLLDTITSLPAVLTVHSQPHAFAGNDTTIYVGNSVQLTATGGGSYIWSNGSTSDTTMVHPTNTTEYTVTVINNGCSDTAIVKVIVDESMDIFVPLAFAPDGPLINSILYVRGKGIKELDFVIYDRWGEKVFERDNVQANDPTAGWDGTYNGKLLSTAVFVYYVKATYYSGEIGNLKGDVTLMR